MSGESSDDVAPSDDIAPSDDMRPSAPPYDRGTPPPVWSPSPTVPPPPGWAPATRGAPPPPGYPVAPGGHPIMPKTNGLAVASLVLGCVGVACCFVPSILAVVLGYVSRQQIDRSYGTETGRGLSTAGIVLGWVGLGLTLLAAIVLVILALAGPSSTVDTHNGVESLRALASGARST